VRFERGLFVAALARASGLAASTVSRPTADHPPRSRDGKTWHAVGPERPTGARV
jgi:hypothetical protein